VLHKQPESRPPFLISCAGGILPPPRGTPNNWLAKVMVTKRDLTEGLVIGVKMVLSNIVCVFVFSVVCV